MGRPASFDNRSNAKGAVVAAGAVATEGGATVVHRRFEAVPDNEPLAQELVAGAFSASDAPLKVRNDVRLAVEELFVNVTSYAYGSGAGTVDVTVRVDSDRRFVSVCLRDEGVAFDPFGREDPSRDAAFEEASIESLGIVLVKSLMDECAYAREGSQNVVTVVRRWGSEEPEALEAHSVEEIDPLKKVQSSLDDGDLAAVVGGLMGGFEPEPKPGLLTARA